MIIDLPIELLLPAHAEQTLVDRFGADCRMPVGKNQTRHFPRRQSQHTVLCIQPHAQQSIDFVFDNTITWRMDQFFPGQYSRRERSVRAIGENEI
ncbi:MAG: hypothetical protein ACT4OO_05535 [Nitrospiraceae bacterium]